MPNQFSQDNHYQISLAPELTDTTNLDPSAYIRQMTGQTPAAPASQAQIANPRAEATASTAKPARTTQAVSAPGAFPLLSFLLSLGFAYLLRTLATDYWRFMYPYTSKGSWLSDLYVSLGPDTYQLLFWIVIGACLLFAIILALNFRHSLTRLRPQLRNRLDLFTLFLIAAIIYCAWPAYELISESPFFDELFQ